MLIILSSTRTVMKQKRLQQVFEHFGIEHLDTA